jgi:predicted PurR-regulated permease PerM
MDLGSHLRTTGSALKNWFVAQCLDSLCVAGLWLVGLLILRIPLAPLWAVLAALFQFIPNMGAVLTVIGPALMAAFDPDEMKVIYVLILFAGIMFADGFFLQPWLMKRTAKVPFWASLITPIVLGILIPFWGILLAVVFAFLRKRKPENTLGPG